VRRFSHRVVGCKIPRKENSPIFFIFFAPPVPVSPGLPEDDPTIDKKQAPRIKTIGLIETFSRVCPKKGNHAPGKWKTSPIPREINEFYFQGILQPTTVSHANIGATPTAQPVLMKAV